MTRVSNALLIIVLAAALAGCEAPGRYQPDPAAPATQVQAPSFTPGDEFWFARRQSIFVEVYEGEKDGLLVFNRGSDDRTLSYAPDLSLVKVKRLGGVGRRYLPNDGQLRFPLAVGRNWSQEFRVFNADGGATNHRTRSCQVVGQGQVEVEAGSFRAFHITCSLTGVGQARVTEEELYYAPAVGRIVLRRQSPGGGETQLIEYSRAGE